MQITSVSSAVRHFTSLLQPDVIQVICGYLVALEIGLNTFKTKEMVLGCLANTLA